jgi:hypothetical protein
MTLDGVYGTRPDLLPRLMVRLVRDDRGGRLLRWVGRPGVELLDLDDHLRYERDSLGRFPRDSDGGITWDAVAGELVLGAMDAESADIVEVVGEFAPEADGLVFLWGSLAMPSVRMGLEPSATHLPDIVSSIPDFWIYSPSDRVVLENSFSGVLTVAHVPTERGEQS